MFLQLLSLAICAALASPAHANDQEPLLLVGVGAGGERLPYKGAKTRSRVLPLVIYENDWLAVSLPTVDLKLPSLGPISFRLRTRIGFEGYEAKDATGLVGMAERKNGLWLGPTAVWGGELGELSLDTSRELTRHSKGQQWRLQYEYPLELGDLTLTPRVGVVGLDRRYVDYFFGVRASEARAGRAAYTGEATRHTELGLRTRYMLSARSMLFMDVSATQLGKAAERSPLVERDRTASVFAGWFYRM
jgi:outer membrane protein